MIRRTDNDTTPPPPSKRCRGNVKAAPIFLAPSTIAGIVGLSLRPMKRVEQVPVEPTKLVDGPRRPRAAKLAPSPKIAEPDSAAGNGGTAADEAAVSPSPVSQLQIRPVEAPFDRPDSPSPAPTARASVALPPPAPKARISDVRYRQAKDRDAREFEAPVDTTVTPAARIDLIRAAAQRLRERGADAAVSPRISLGAPRPKADVPLPANPFAARRAELERAVAFLKTRGVLVSVHDRQAPVRRYFVSGRRDTKLAEEVIEIARERGMEAGHEQ